MNNDDQEISDKSFFVKFCKQRSQKIIDITVIVLGVIAIYYSIQIYQISNEINVKRFYGLTAQGLSTTWGASDKIVHVWRYIVNSGVILNDPAVLRESYGYYINAKSFLTNNHFPSKKETEIESLKINNFAEYDRNLNEYQTTYDNLNIAISKNIDESFELEKVQNQYFMYLIITQIITVFLGVYSVRRRNM
ncbi:hypothetical protein KJ934_00655 [Patescibacteria group bacterium]|nr:hypothetical protein [Patescibacteria group bacterium]MBU4353612.1 hypothetical protein [Patescibacteria group bacterium]MBU4477029.1 hypothetical protein [Patescibacteria group bacterium]MCG2698812.1 hypothetical protein [Candidatus Parcubacteria bacterium]